MREPKHKEGNNRNSYRELVQGCSCVVIMLPIEGKTFLCLLCAGLLNILLTSEFFNRRIFVLPESHFLK